MTLPFLMLIFAKDFSFKRQQIITSGIMYLPCCNVHAEILLRVSQVMNGPTATAAQQKCKWISFSIKQRLTPYKLWKILVYSTRSETNLKSCSCFERDCVFHKMYPLEVSLGKKKMSVLVGNFSLCCMKQVNFISCEIRTRRSTTCIFFLTSNL